MFSNLSHRWRTRVRIIVVAWVLVLVVAAFVGTAATVREQAGAEEGREKADELVGVVASALAGDAFEFAVGPPMALDCDITPVREGVDYQRTFKIYTDEPDLAFAQAAARLAAHEGTDGPLVGTEHWGFSTDDFLSVQLDLSTNLPDGPQVYGSVSTGCRPGGAEVGAVMPAERPDTAEALADQAEVDDFSEAIAYGRVECARGGEVETWWWVDRDRRVPHTVDGCA